MIYTGFDRNKGTSCGVAIFEDDEWKKNIESYMYINEKISPLDSKLKENTSQS